MAKANKIRIPRARQQLYRYRVAGGPWHGLDIKLPEETMVFRVNDQQGKYRHGVWENV